MLIRRTLVAFVCDGASSFKRLRRHYLNPLIFLTVSFYVFWSIDKWPASVLYDPLSFGCRHVRQAITKKQTGRPRIDPYTFALTA